MSLIREITIVLNKQHLEIIAQEEMEQRKTLIDQEIVTTDSYIEDHIYECLLQMGLDLNLRIDIPSWYLSRHLVGVLYGGISTYIMFLNYGECIEVNVEMVGSGVYIHILYGKDYHVIQ